VKKVLTMKQLEARYSGEWVLLVNPVQRRNPKLFEANWFYTVRIEVKCIIPGDCR
jgi:hypothetical protein